jgi:hypothetical protein
VLFFFGCWALVSLTFFHLSLKLFKRLKQKTVQPPYWWTCLDASPQWSIARSVGM